MTPSEENVFPLSSNASLLIDHPSTSDPLMNDTMNSSAMPSPEVNDTSTSSQPRPPEMTSFMSTIVVLYVVVCCFGVVTNGLVVYVLVVSARLERVTNIYILNLAVADLLYLLGIPFTVVTAIQETWIFGETMCKVFYALTSINWFTSVYTLTILSADRYFAICHAFWSIPYRTPTVARLACLAVWALSLVLMLPIILYGRTVDDFGRTSCTVDWPRGGLSVDPHRAFFGYSFGLGFAVPLGMITVFYCLVVLRLKGLGPNRNQPTKSIRSQLVQTRVTIMVTTVVAVNLVCWLPYWIFQMVLLFAEGELPRWVILAYQLNTVVNYANSALNPVLYAFLSDSFRNSLGLVFGRSCYWCCCTGSLLGKTLIYDGRNGTTTRRSRSSRRAVGEAAAGELGTVEAEGGPATCSVVLISDDIARSCREWKGVDDDEDAADAAEAAVEDEDEDAGQRREMSQQQLLLMLSKQEEDAPRDAVEMTTYPLY